MNPEEMRTEDRASQAKPRLFFFPQRFTHFTIHFTICTVQSLEKKLISPSPPAFCSKFSVSRYYFPSFSFDLDSFFWFWFCWKRKGERERGRRRRKEVVEMEMIGFLIGGREGRKGKGGREGKGGKAVERQWKCEREGDGMKCHVIIGS